MREGLTGNEDRLSPGLLKKRCWKGRLPGSGTAEMLADTCAQRLTDKGDPTPETLERLGLEE